MGEVLKKRLKQETFPSVEEEAVLNLLVTSYYLRKDLNAIYADYGLTMGQYNVLRILKGVYPEGHARCDIIDRMVEPAPDVTRLLDRLVDEGYAERHRSEEDARRSIARITQKGLQKLKTITEDLEAFSDNFSNLLSPQECRELSELCEKIYADRVE